MEVVRPDTDELAAYLAVRELTTDFLSFRASCSWPTWREVDL